MLFPLLLLLLAGGSDGRVFSAVIHHKRNVHGIVCVVKHIPKCGGKQHKRWIRFSWNCLMTLFIQSSLTLTVSLQKKYSLLDTFDVNKMMHKSSFSLWPPSCISHTFSALCIELVCSPTRSFAFIKMFSRSVQNLNYYLQYLPGSSEAQSLSTCYTHCYSFLLHGDAVLLQNFLLKANGMFFSYYLLNFCCWRCLFILLAHEIKTRSEIFPGKSLLRL